MSPTYTDHELARFKLMDEHEIMDTRPIKATELEVLQFGWQHSTGGGPEIHRAGCAHGKKAESVRPFELTDLEEYPDDWYAIGPCAKRR